MNNDSAVITLPRVLIVEDEVLVRVAFADFLECSGFHVAEAASGIEATVIMNSGGPKIDLVFSDIRMPGAMDGFQLALWIREHHPEMPVFLTSGDIGKTRTTFELAPGQPFFQKPYDFDKVATRMREVLDTLPPEVAA